LLAARKSQESQTKVGLDRKAIVRALTLPKAPKYTCPSWRGDWYESVKTKRVIIGVLAFAAISAVAFAQGFVNIKELLTGYEEVPSVSTTGNGNFSARIRKDNTIDWELRYSDLQGAVQQSHIHFGQAGVNGGISVFLCTNLGNGPAGTQPCPAPPATISGTITVNDVSPNIAATAAARTQGINTGEFEELVAAMRAGATYVNIHSTLWPGGEVRSQIQNGTP